MYHRPSLFCAFFDKMHPFRFRTTMSTREQELEKRLAEVEAALKAERQRADEAVAQAKTEHDRAETERKRADDAVTQAKAAAKEAHDRWVNFVKQTSKLSCSNYYRYVVFI